MTTQSESFLPAGYAVKFASLRDMRAIYHLERAAFTADSYNYLELLVLMLSPGMVNLKALAPDGSPVGYVAGGKLLGLGRTWIITIGVHPEHQRQGVGRCLLETCEALLRSPAIYLTVRKSNERAIVMYMRSGYRRVGIKPGYYTNGETGIEMRKDRDPVR
jgi:ribosomal-protein-alanine N-acetyltransferase